ncbi:MAG: hypothetical protein MUF87_03135 [Anaerolineae bacterium]|nr:hypothetical protein [Anaerolineae bacterium]
MSTLIVGVFDNELNLDQALSALHDRDIKDDRLEILRGQAHQPDTPIDNIPLIPIAIGTNNAGTSQQGQTAPALAPWVLERVPEGAEMDYYRRVASNNGVVVFIHADPEDTASIASIFEQAGASRVDQIN